MEAHWPLTLDIFVQIEIGIYIKNTVENQVNFSDQLLEIFSLNIQQTKTSLRLQEQTNENKKPSWETHKSKLGTLV